MDQGNLYEIITDCKPTCRCCEDDFVLKAGTRVEYIARGWDGVEVNIIGTSVYICVDKSNLRPVQGG